jgi:hypothetical protein
MEDGVSALDRHIRAALLAGNYTFDDPIAHRFVKIGEIRLCKSLPHSWYLQTGLAGGVSLSWLTKMHLDLVRVAHMKATPTSTPARGDDGGEG